MNFLPSDWNLGGSDFSGTVRRSEPSDVSESQREFIDVSFRMALAQVATPNGTTSLVMDALSHRWILYSLSGLLAYWADSAKKKQETDLS